MLRRLIASAVAVLLVTAAAIVLSQTDKHKHQDSSPLSKLAEETNRPEWAPIPVIRGQMVAIAPLKPFLSDNKAINRARAAFLLGQIGEPKQSTSIEPLLDDKDSLVRLHAAIALACMGSEAGIPGCEKVLRQSPEWMRVYAVYGLWTIGSDEAFESLAEAQSGQPEFIAESIKKALKTPPQKIRISPDLIADESDTDSAQQAWTEAQSIYISEADWWFHKGGYNQSIRCHMTAAFFDPSNPENYSVGAYLLWSLGRNKEADAMLEDGVDACPKDPDAYFNQGLHFYNTKRYKKAEAPLKKAVELNGDHRARRTCAHCLEKLGKLDQSLRQWDQLRKLLPKDKSVENNYRRVKGMLRSVPSV